MSPSWKQLLFQLLLLVISCRHVNTKTPGPTPTSLSEDPVSPLPADVRRVVLKGTSETEKVVVLNPVSLTLKCTWTGSHNKPPNITGYWSKDGNEMENSRLTVQLENEQYNLMREFSIANEEDLGNYSCIFGNEAKIDFILAAPQIGEVRDKPIVSYVGDSVVMLCKMEESKPKPNTWHWFKDNGTDKEQIDVAAEPLRYEIKNDNGKTRLVVHNVTEADSGLYYCGAVYAITTTFSHVELKIITFYEPLKPFISILVEVIILVAIILLYEKTQSKKDEPAAGNSTNADSTNTLSQGENSGQEGSSSMRQRKV